MKPPFMLKMAGKLSNRKCRYISKRGLSFGAVSLSASFLLVVRRDSMASSASSVDGENNNTVEETTKESFLEKIQMKFGDEVMKAFESK